MGNPAKNIRGFWADDDELLASGQTKEIPMEPITIGQEQRYLQTTKTPIVGPQQQKLLVGFAHDITYLKTIEQQILVEFKYSKTLNSINEILRSPNEDSRLFDQACELILQAMSAQHVEIIVTEGQRTSCSASAAESSHEIGYFQLQRISAPIEYANQQLGTLTIDRLADASLYTDDDEKLARAIANQLATAMHQQRLIEKMNRLAQHDSLTDLPNRHYLQLKLQEAIQTAASNGTRCTVIFLDLDGSKTVNDTLGHQVGDWHQRLGLPITVSINTSPPEIEQPSYVTGLLNTIEQLNFDPSMLELEVTETFIMQRIGVESDRLLKLREQGIKISIDDFGTGYSCMSYLQQLPVDTLKIDKSFIDALTPESLDETPLERTKRNSIARTIIDLARSMDLKTVVEGIETEQQFATIRALGADYGQGFLFSKPLLANEAFELFRVQANRA